MLGKLRASSANGVCVCVTAVQYVPGLNEREMNVLCVCVVVCSCSKRVCVSVCSLFKLCLCVCVCSGVVCGEQCVAVCMHSLLLHVGVCPQPGLCCSM